MKMDFITVKLAKESFEINREQKFSDVSGSIEIAYSDVPLPTFLQIQVIGEERIGDKLSFIMDDIYLLTSIEWTQRKDNRHELPFHVNIPCDIPSSLQFNQLDGVYYYLKIKVVDKIIVQPIHLHQTSCLLNKEKVYWGTVNKLDAKWRYEIQFPNIYDLINTQHYICIRFKSTSQQKQQQFTDCCLLGFQIIQSIQKKGYNVEYQTVTTETKILTKLDTTWKEPYLLGFTITNGILPTTSTKSIEIQHDIKLSLTFSNQHQINLDFPITITGYHPTLIQQNLTNHRLTQDSDSLLCSSSSRSSNYSKEEKDSAIDLYSFNSSGS